jgi:hypothetical protein
MTSTSCSRLEINKRWEQFRAFVQLNLLIKPNCREKHTFDCSLVSQHCLEILSLKTLQRQVPKVGSDQVAVNQDLDWVFLEYTGLRFVTR